MAANQRYRSEHRQCRCVTAFNTNSSTPAAPDPQAAHLLRVDGLPLLPEPRDSGHVLLLGRGGLVSGHELGVHVHRDGTNVFWLGLMPQQVAQEPAIG